MNSDPRRDQLNLRREKGERESRTRAPCEESRAVKIPRRRRANLLKEGSKETAVRAGTFSRRRHRNRYRGSLAGS